MRYISNLCQTSQCNGNNGVLLLTLVKQSTIVLSRNFLQFSSASANPAPESEYTYTS